MVKPLGLLPLDPNVPYHVKQLVGISHCHWSLSLGFWSRHLTRLSLGSHWAWFSSNEKPNGPPNRSPRHFHRDNGLTIYLTTNNKQLLYQLLPANPLFHCIASVVCPSRSNSPIASVPRQYLLPLGVDCCIGEVFILPKGLWFQTKA